MKNGEWKEKRNKGRYRSRATPYSLFATFFSQHSSENQRLHMRDVVAAHFIGHGTDASGARHGMTSKKQMIAGADQAGVEQHRIDHAEFAGGDALRQQAALKLEQRPDEEFRDLVGGFHAAFVQQIVDQPVHVGK